MGSLSPGNGDYRLVTGKFIHDGAEVLDLCFNGRTTSPLGITANHPVWSVTRQEWLPAAALKKGEGVYSLTGSPVMLTDVQSRPGTHTVYNLEVYQDHVFYVSTEQILVYNGCAAPKRVYEANPKHGLQQRRNASPAPANPEKVLETALQNRTRQLIGVDKSARLRRQ